MNTRKRLRELLARNSLLIAPGAFDGLSARLVEQAGFEAVYLSGGAVARSAGFPDLGLMSMAEVIERAREVTAAVKIPVIADADTGYGNAVSVVRTVREFERAGVAAIHIEDQVTPKRCGHLEGKEVIAQGEMEDKIRAALEARSDPDFILIARTDARAVNSLDDAIARGRAFVKLGADAAFIEAAESEAELETIARELKDVPLIVNMTKGGKTPLLPAERLETMGYRVAIFPSDTQRAAIHAMKETLAALKRDGSTEAMDKTMVSFKERDRIAGLEEWERMEKRYLPKRRD
ncbi:MAG TPA: isocitrate lyase/phosphoenolpyruvate mutase family protein [Verrucomicrobiae bacterium]|nr:isocitrate lyase/phosphoenolpyruvate mutase family protein [Verrucomicrobiae bacterium]